MPLFDSPELKPAGCLTKWLLFFLSFCLYVMAQFSRGGRLSLTIRREIGIKTRWAAEMTASCAERTRPPPPPKWFCDIGGLIAVPGTITMPH